LTYFVTGATGFIGRHLLEELLKRDGTIYALVREGSRGKLDSVVERLGAEEGRVVPVAGDLSKDGLGVDGFDERIDNLFHLAAIYDVDAEDEAMEKANVDGTRHVIEFANAHEVGRFHHVSSIAVAGSYKGVFQEDMFDEEQKLPHAYHSTKFDSEKLVRRDVEAKTLIYRPGIVVGHSETGEMDKIDGPYYFFKLLQKLRHALPEWFPLAGPEGGQTNLVPVDFVARALDHIAHMADDDLPSDTYHLVDPEPMSVGQTLNEFAKAAHAPQFAMRIDPHMTNAVPKAVRSGIKALPTVKRIRETALRDLGIPPAALDNRDFFCTFDARDSQRALKGTGIAVPPLSTYAPALWDYWERKLDPDLFRERSLAHSLGEKKVLITGASSGIGKETALKIGEAGGEVILVSRTREKLEEVAKQVEEAGGTAHVHPADLSKLEEVERVAEEVLDEHGGVDVLINNAGRSIRRSVKASYDRFHDYERTMAAELLWRAQADHGPHAGHARAQVGPHREHLFDRRADEHAALLGLRRLQGRARRLLPLRRSRGRRRRGEVHHDLHAARAHADDRADRHVQGVPHADPRRGGADGDRRDDRQAQAQGVAAGDLRRGALRHVPEDCRPRAQHRVQPLPGLKGREGQGRREEAAGGEEGRRDVDRGRGHGLPDAGRALLMPTRVSSRVPLCGGLTAPLVL